MSKTKRKDGEVWVKRTVNRQYRVIEPVKPDPTLFDTGSVVPVSNEPIVTNEVEVPALYEVKRGDVTIATIVYRKPYWRVVVAGVGGSVFGEAVSPVGLNKWGDVKEWAVGYFSKENLNGKD
jgi:hypothetical protein